jgi:hypothetical protein
MEFTEHAGIVGHWTFTYDDGTVIERKNLITGSGLNWFASLFINETTNDVPFYIALGTGTAAAVSTDTKLGAEGFRKLIASKSRQNNMVRLRMFLLQSEANQDWGEFGVYAAGTENLESGVLINRLVAPISKAFNQLLTIECKLYFNAG